MQVSDAQDMHFVRRTMLHMLARAYDRERPDLVVFTGDNILGNHLRDRRFGSGTLPLSREEEFGRMKKALTVLLRPLEERGIPFTMIFGNHDDMNPFTKEEQLAIFRSFRMFVYGDGVSAGNHALDLFSSDGQKRLCTLWFFDSSRCDETGQCEQSIQPEAVEWFVRRSDRLCEENGGTYVPSYAFVHIPLPAVCGLLREDPNGVLCADGKRVRLDPEKADGILSEEPSVVTADAGLFERLKERHVSAVVFGHDHRNNFVGKVDGVTLVQTSCASFRCYGTKQLRGVRTFDLRADAPETFVTRFLSYEELCGSEPLSALRYFWDADEYEKQKAVAAAAAVGVSACAVGAAVLRNRKRKDR